MRIWDGATGGSLWPHPLSVCWRRVEARDERLEMSVRAVDEVMETDLLVIGGGIGGPFAALFASEAGARVVLLEKAAVRRSGATGMGIGSWHQLVTGRDYVG